jgi:hypothetical protein
MNKARGDVMTMQHKISRRRALQGLGVTLALPWLESLLPRGARAQAGTPPRRYVALYFPNGTADFWKPRDSTATSWKLSPILEPLAPVKRYVTVLGNVSNYAPFGGHVEPSHSNLGASTWTCVPPGGQNKNDNGISVDQVIAKQIGAQTALASLQIGLSTLDSSTDGLPGQHSRSMAWKSATEPLYKIVNPQAAFDRLTSNGTVGMPGMGMPNDPLAERRRALGRSVLDFVLDDATKVQAKLGVSDRQKLDQFLTSVRSLEQRVAMPGMQVSAPACMPLSRPDAVYGVGKVPAGYNRGEHAELMIDLVVMAFACDLTRVCSFMLDDARSDFVYNFINERKFTDAGSTESTAKVGGYHGLQHAGERNNGFATIGWWNAQRAAELAGKLMAIPEGDGNMLDNSTIVFCSGMKGGNHDAGDIPIALIGGGGKTASGNVLKLDRHLEFPDEQRLADVHLTVLKGVFDCPDTEFGASAGIIEDLLA